MAAPAYSNDLTTIATGDLNFDAGTWDESSDAGWDTAGAMVDDENLMYATTSVNTGEAADSCTSAQYTKVGTGSGAAGPGTIMYQHTAAFTVPADGAILAQSLWAAPLALNPYAGTFGTAEAGVSCLIGDSFGVFDVHYVSGSDRAPAPEGGWATYAVDPTVTPDGSVGTPTTTTCVGIGIAAAAQARGNPQAMQYVRYGRCEVEYTVGDVATPATFDGYATLDNAAADRFNLLQIIEGGFKARGLMTFGTATTAVHFDDSDKSIVIADDPKVGSAFNKGVVNNAASVLNWTNIAITNLSSVAKYTFVVNDSATTDHTGCVFTDVGAFTYGSNSTQSKVTYRRQGLVTQGGGTFTGCTFDKPLGTVGLSVDDLSVVTENTFTSDGTGYAVDLGTTTDISTIIWDNSDSGYAGTDGTTGNETIHITYNGVSDKTISVASGASTPTIHNDGTGAVLVVAGQVTTTITATDSTDNSVIQNTAVTVKAASTVGGLPFEDSVTITRSGSVATVTHTAHGLDTAKKVEIEGANENEYNRIRTITKIDADSYSFVVSGTPATPATGTIVSTALILDGLTDASGEISDTRALAVDQNYTLSVRKGSGQPVFVGQDLSGIISNANGLSRTVSLIPD